MRSKKVGSLIALALVAAPIAPAFASSPGNALCGRYSFSFSAAESPSGYLSGAGFITSNCMGRLSSGSETTIDSQGVVCTGSLSGTYSVNSNGIGRASISLVPEKPSTSCPTVKFTEAIAVGQSGAIVKGIHNSGGLVTIQEEWVKQ